MQQRHSLALFQNATKKQRRAVDTTPFLCINPQGFLNCKGCNGCKMVEKAANTKITPRSAAPLYHIQCNELSQAVSQRSEIDLGAVGHLSQIMAPLSLAARQMMQMQAGVREAFCRGKSTKNSKRIKRTVNAYQIPVI